MLCFFDNTNFVKVGIIDERPFGNIYLTRNTNTNKLFMVKESYESCIYAQNQQSFFDEVYLYSDFLKYPSIISINGINIFNFDNSPYPLIFSDSMINGSLDNFLLSYKNKMQIKANYIDPSRKDFKYSQLYFILFGIALGMKHCHSKNYIINDLIPSNIWLDENYYPHISDFEKIPYGQYANNKNALYIAPEVISSSFSQKESNIYSFSIIAYILLTGNSTFFENTQPIKHRKTPDLSKITDETVKEFLKSCMIDDPSKRPTADEIVDELLNEKYINFFGTNLHDVNKYFDLFDEVLTIKKNPNTIHKIATPRLVNQKRKTLTKNKIGKYNKYKPNIISLTGNSEPTKSSPKFNKLNHPSILTPVKNNTMKVVQSSDSFSNIFKQSLKKQITIAIEKSNFQRKFLTEKASSTIIKPKPKIQKLRSLSAISIKKEIILPIPSKKSIMTKNVPDFIDINETMPSDDSMFNDEFNQIETNHRISDLSYFVINIRNVKNLIILDVFKSLKIQTTKKNSESSFVWFDDFLGINDYTKFDPSKYVNRIPDMKKICGNQNLFNCLEQNRYSYPNDFKGFTPITFIPPNGITLFEEKVEELNSPNISWIWNSLDYGNCGDQNILIENASDFIMPRPVGIIQNLISPFLIDSHKFQLQMFALITDLNPLKIYFYKEGVAYFCIEPYETPNEKNTAKFIIPNAIPKNAKEFEYVRPASIIIQKISKNHPKLMRKIQKIIVLTIISLYEDIVKKVSLFCKQNERYFPGFDNENDNNYHRFFHLVGFDIQIDYNGNPFIIGLNDNPEKNYLNAVDKEIKNDLVKRELELIEITLDGSKRNICEWEKIYPSKYKSLQSLNINYPQANKKRCRSITSVKKQIKKHHIDDIY